MLTYQSSYVNGVPPQPAIDVKILGPRSRAGLSPNPALIPYAVPMVKTINPIRKGARFAPTPMFLSSKRAKMVPTKMAVPKS